MTLARESRNDESNQATKDSGCRGTTPSGRRAARGSSDLADQAASAEHVLTFDDNHTAIALYGEGEQTLRLLEQQLGVVASARGNQVRIAGPKAGVDEAKRALEELYQVIRGGRVLRADDVRQAVRMVHDEPEVSLRDVYEDVLASVGGRRKIRAKNQSQREYIEMIRKHDVSIAIGPAGTGKTYLAMAMAISELNRKQVSRVVLTRPAVEAGERLGFLPGDLAEKVNPYMRPLYDALHDMMDYEKARRLSECGEIEIAPLAFMRGRTLNDSFVILDEAQNATSEQMKMFLTRLGYNSKALITGDITQIDLPRGTESGLVEAIRILDGIEGIGFMRFSKEDVVRHPLVQSIIQAYEATDQRHSEPPPPPSGNRGSDSASADTAAPDGREPKGEA